MTSQSSYEDQASDDDANREQVQRFIQEAKAAAQLKHPNIVMIYEVGDFPKHYFTMEYIQGETLSRSIKEDKINRTRNGLLRKVPKMTADYH